MSKHYILVHQQARQLAAEQCHIAPDGWHVRITPPTRTLEQNAKLWSMLSEIAAQVIWHGRKLDAESWKHIFTSSLKRMDVVPGIDGGFVALGLSTSKMTKKELSFLIELIYAFGIEHNVKFNDTSEGISHDGADRYI